MFIETDNNDYIRYYGLYFKEVGQNGRIFKFTKDKLPLIIYTAKMVFAKTELVNAEPVKIMKIFENDKFYGQLIVEEDKLSY